MKRGAARQSAPIRKVKTGRPSERVQGSWKVPLWPRQPHIAAFQHQLTSRLFSRHAAYLGAYCVDWILSLRHSLNSPFDLPSNPSFSSPHAPPFPRISAICATCIFLSTSHRIHPFAHFDSLLLHVTATMPPKKARSSSPASERRERLTLAKLASYDDVATDALVDHVRLLPTYGIMAQNTDSFYP